MNLILHPATDEAVEQFLANPGHALLIEGLAGAGKGALATYIAYELLNVDNLSNYPFYMLVVPIDNAITIEVIRSVQRFMRLKTIGDRPLRRVLIVENAQTMTIEAQNAFLKLLEEPPADTIILLTVVNQMALLPTIRSRAQHVRVNLPGKSDVVKYYTNQGFEAAVIDRAYHMSDGHSGLMNSLLTHDGDHPLIAQIQIAKDILSRPLFERLALVDQLTKQRGEIEELLRALRLVSHAGLTQASQRGQMDTIRRWHKSLHTLQGAQVSYSANPNLKLLMTDLMLSL